MDFLFELLFIIMAFGLLLMAFIIIVRIMQERARINKEIGKEKGSKGRWSSHTELESAFKKFEFKPSAWRKDKKLPKVQGMIIHLENQATGVGKHKINIFGDFGFYMKDEINIAGKTITIFENPNDGVSDNDEDPLYAYADDTDVNMLVIGASGAGKTKSLLYPNMEYAMAAGMSFVTLTTDESLLKNFYETAKIYQMKALEIRPTKPELSDTYNPMTVINRLSDEYEKKGNIAFLADAKRYAVSLAQTLLELGNINEYELDAFHHDAATEIVACIILMISRFAGIDEKHILSISRLIRQVVDNSEVQPQLKFIALDCIPEEEKFLYKKLTEKMDDKTRGILYSLSDRLNMCINDNTAHIVGCEGAITAREFTDRRVAILIEAAREKGPEQYLVNLFLKQFVRELKIQNELEEEKGVNEKEKAVFYLDDLGVIPQLDGLSTILKDMRGMRCSCMMLFQSIHQLRQYYGIEAEEIQENSHLTYYMGSAPEAMTNQVTRIIGQQVARVNLNADQGGMFTNSTKVVQPGARVSVTEEDIKALPINVCSLRKVGWNPFKVTVKDYTRCKMKFPVTEGTENKKELFEVQYADKKKMTFAMIDKNSQYI